MRAYKLTKSDGTTFGGMQWGEWVEHTAPGGKLRRRRPCTKNVLHAYRTPEQAEMYNPVQGDFWTDALLWESDADVCVDEGTEIGCTRIRTLRTIDRVIPTAEERAEIAIRCVLVDKLRWDGQVEWQRWAGEWLSGTDRSADAAAAVNNLVFHRLVLADEGRSPTYPVDAAAEAAVRAAHAAKAAEAAAEAAACYRAASRFERLERAASRSVENAEQSVRAAEAYADAVTDVAQAAADAHEAHADARRHTEGAASHAAHAAYAAHAHVSAIVREVLGRRGTPSDRIRVDRAGHRRA